MIFMTPKINKNAFSEQFQIDMEPTRTVLDLFAIMHRYLGLFAAPCKQRAGQRGDDFER